MSDSKSMMKNITTIPTNYSSKEQAMKASERQAKILTARGYPTKAIDPICHKYDAEMPATTENNRFAIPRTGWKARVQDA